MSNLSKQQCVIVGASHAGAQAAESVRKAGWQGQILLVGDEPHLPYHRPPLSKDFLLSNKKPEDILIKPASLYTKNQIDVLLETRVEGIDRNAKSLLLSSGQKQPYDKLVLATGARARQLPISGADKEGVFYLRSIDDVERIRCHVIEGRNAVIIGGGYIGLETAAALRALKMNVTILEMMPRILQRVTTPEVSAFYHRVHEEEGVNIVTNVAVDSIQGEGQANAVVCDGVSYDADIVIVGAGVVPNIELAKEADLETEETGIVVNEYCATSDPDIFAIGDCCWHHNAIYDRWLRLESVPNAMEQARVAGASVCGVYEKPYTQLPWFWSDQYDIKLQIVGLSQGYDNVVVRGDINNGRQFAVFYFEGEKLLAVDAVNMPSAFMIGKRMLMAATIVDKAGLADANIELKSLL